VGVVTGSASTVDPPAGRDKGENRADSPVERRFQLNDPVTHPAITPTTTYRLAPALGVRLVGRSVVTLAFLVLAATLLGVITDAGWVLAGAVTAIGLFLVGAWAWYLLRRAWAVRLSDEGYAVRLLGGIGAATATWSSVEEVVAASPGGSPCLVFRLGDGRVTRLPMAALEGDADAFAHDVRRRVRDAHTPGGATDSAPPES
jgi:hypothetical protein